MKACLVCTEVHYGKGYCVKHYYTFKKYGDPHHITERRDGIKKHPLYITYRNMMRRCYKVDTKDYPMYGGRGIKVCDEWRNSIDKFIEDMGERPDGYTLDRIDNTKDYTADNCKWSTPREQSLNTRRTSKTPNVYWVANRGKFLIQGYIEKRYIYGGYAQTLSEAIARRTQVGL